MQESPEPSGVMSACAGDDMAPKNIAERAQEQNGKTHGIEKERDGLEQTDDAQNDADNQRAFDGAMNILGEFVVPKCRHQNGEINERDDDANEYQNEWNPTQDDIIGFGSRVNALDNRNRRNSGNPQDNGDCQQDDEETFASFTHNSYFARRLWRIAQAT